MARAFSVLQQVRTQIHLFGNLEDEHNSTKGAWEILALSPGLQVLPVKSILSSQINNGVIVWEDGGILMEFIEHCTFKRHLILSIHRRQ